jgi:hypothetical protein
VLERSRWSSDLPSRSFRREEGTGLAGPGSSSSCESRSPRRRPCRHSPRRRRDLHRVGVCVRPTGLPSRPRETHHRLTGGSAGGRVEWAAQLGGHDPRRRRGAAFGLDRRLLHRSTLTGTTAPNCCFNRRFLPPASRPGQSRLRRQFRDYEATRAAPSTDRLTRVNCRAGDDGPPRELPTRAARRATCPSHNTTLPESRSTKRRQTIAHRVAPPPRSWWGRCRRAGGDPRRRCPRSGYEARSGQTCPNAAKTA